MLRLDFTHTQIHWTASFLFSHPHTKAPVRYNLVFLLCTIQSRILFVYDTISELSRVQYQSRSHCYYNT